MITAALGADGSDSIAVVGGKAARLSVLARDFPVPRGFAITVAGFKMWQREGAQSLPEIVASELDLALGEVPFPVAVRSSGTHEDGSVSSFAGLHETFLNVRERAGLHEAVLACWRSAGQDRVVDYRMARGLASDGEVAILVQELIEAQTAGVAFTANPVTSDVGEILINSAWGLGPSIVDGTVNPDNFLVRKKGLEIIRKEISDKDVMTVLVLGGTEETNVPAHLRSAPSLTDEQVLEIAEMGLKLERIFGWPADYEWAIGGDRLWLLQCRPITTLR